MRGLNVSLNLSCVNGFPSGCEIHATLHKVVWTRKTIYEHLSLKPMRLTPKIIMLLSSSIPCITTEMWVK